MNTNKILVVDDEVGIRELLLEILQDEGYQVLLAENASAAREIRSQGRPDLVLLDIWMPDTDGITLLKEWSSAGLLTMPVVMMSGHGSIDTAVEATKIGAFDFLEKPIALQKLLTTVVRALKKGAAINRPNLSLFNLGKSQVILDLKKRLTQIANFKTPLLLMGERGSGTELCARYLHEPNTPWITLENSTQLYENPNDLLQQAKDGLLYMSEIGDLNKQEQKGLQFLLAKLEKFNVRLICATTKSLPSLVELQSFDASLYKSLSVLTLAIPSLREHREDIPDLAIMLLSQLVESKEAPPREFTVAALNTLRNHTWAGNMDELSNVVKTLALTSLSDEISQDEVSRVLVQFKSSLDSTAQAPQFSMDIPLREARDIFERAYFDHHIKLSSGNMSRVAEKVGLERTHLYRKLKQLGINVAKRGVSEE
ncbi:sigma-54-dependent transcriptional regulator [Sulfurirhabdus autotrophica]|uniref:DNA-binding NtrC family response regulator n=1 Tax=Sulfurirhabdus autotrophica TaxID=1706046 RepID=A0A4R3XQ76_9PROT|nr:sigma-54 dependent transcriptional regulator [Sulfurirhabdus autotrophica]TCV80255.1 DNA-binding NtrC family response regulator [Sulfurirhabdus autotrophica]